MANEEQVARLKRSVEEWNGWRNAYPKEAVDLRGAGFAGANLNGVSLNEADLAGANLNAADLVEADLSGADLLGARLSGANLYGATLAKADLFETIFGGTNLKDARGLEECNHYGPSTLDFRTIQRSWPLPTNFLRGCGLPENLITYLPSLLSGPIQFYSCFISYSHADKSFARRLHDSLQARGIRVWLDERQLLPGDDIHEQVDIGIKRWDKVLLCASEASLNSWWVDSEINKAMLKEAQLMKERKKKTLALIPLNLDGHLFKWENGKADEVRSRLAANFTGWETDNAKFEAEFEKVVRALKTGDAGREPPPMPKL